MSKILSGLMVIIGALVFGGLFGLFEAYVIQDLGILYNVPVLNTMKFGQIVGLTFCIELLTFKVGKKSTDDEYGMVESLSIKLLVYLFIWGFAYLMFHFIK